MDSGEEFLELLLLDPSLEESPSLCSKELLLLVNSEHSLLDFLSDFPLLILSELLEDLVDLLELELLEDSFSNFDSLSESLHL